MNEHDQEFQTFFEPSQYAYKKHTSTVTALIQVLDSIKLAVDQKQYSVATFIYGGPQLSRQNKILHGKIKFFTAKYNSSRQNKILHGKIKFTTAKYNSPRQNKILHAKYNSPRQNKIHHGKIKFATAK